MTKWNKDISTAPKDKRVIFWMGSNKGFPDMTFTFYWDNKKNNWVWDESISEDPLHRPDLVKGWVLYPEVPKGKDDD